MEYVHGEDLRKVLMEVHQRRDQMPIAMVSSIVAGAASGLHHAHVQLGPDHKPLNIVHRDVSPANILIGYDGAVKVVDFGIAKAALRTVETRSGTLKGKVSYMSPEQVTGQPVDRRSDVFALGIVLYEVATARRLFKGDNDFLTMSAIVQANIPRPSQFRTDLPRVLEDIIMTALAPAPADRFQSAEELRAALESFTSSIGMRIAPHAVADYMKKLFGLRAEPWLVDDEPTMTTTIDFDGSASGVVQPPEGAIREHAFPPSLRPSASAPIVHARTEIAGPPPPDQLGPAWPEPPPPAPPPRNRRRVTAIALGTALAAGLGTVIAVQASSSSHVPEEAAKIEMTAEPAPKTEDPPAAPKAADDTELAKTPSDDTERVANKPDAKKPVVKKPADTELLKPGAKKPVVKKPADTELLEPGSIAKKPDAKKPVVKKPADTELLKPDAVAKKPPKKPAKPPSKQPAGQWDPNALFAPK
jgi:hypothetical protein